MKVIFLHALIILFKVSSGLVSEDDLIFPLKAISIIKGEKPDKSTNEMHKIHGIVRFTQPTRKSHVLISINITGLPLRAVKRGFHVHALAISSLSDNIAEVCASTGMHYNPFNKTHGLLENPIRHNGDLGNLMSDENGTILTELVDNKMTLLGRNSIVGRSLVLHEDEDDSGLKGTYASLSTGTSGARIACGTIGVFKFEQKKKLTVSSFSVITSKIVPLNVGYLFLNKSYINLSLPEIAFVRENITFDTDNMTSIFDRINHSVPRVGPVFDLFYKTLTRLFNVSHALLNKETENKTLVNEAAQRMNQSVPIVQDFLRKCFELISSND